MASFTREAIKASFLRLLEERPFNRITVKDIVDGCGINRNSFYYHFQDIPTLLEEMIRGETDAIISRYPSVGSIEECLEVAARFALEHRSAVMHIYHSVSRDIYERYLWELCDYAVRTYFDAVFPDARISAGDRDVLLRYFKCETFGAVTDWLERGMEADVIADFRRLCELKKGHAEEMVRRCEEEQK